jgi:hypothetical protein
MANDVVVDVSLQEGEGALAARVEFLVVEVRRHLAEKALRVFILHQSNVLVASHSFFSFLGVKAVIP